MIGTTLGPYRIDRELGAGGMGRVYAATGPTGVVALKVIHPHLVADADALRRFGREAAVGISIRHPNVVATLATGEDEGQHWLALEYVEGQTLHALQEELGTVPEELCRHVAHEVAAGLAAVHAAGIVHRDLKPENVIISRCTAPGHDRVAERPGADRRGSEGNLPHRCDHVVKVMDLGVARGAEDDSRLTQTGAFVGSLQYAAPEQFTGGGKGLDGRADLHALGVLLYELSTGANPYQDTDWRVVFQHVLKDMPRRLGAVNPQVSPFFEEVVHTLLAKDRDQRFASAAELAAVLEAGEHSPWWSSKAQSIRGATHRPLRRIKIPRETALVGRDGEMAKLRAAFEKTKAGEGQVVLVEGEAGIGKSRLVDEFVALLQREGEDLDSLYGSYPPGGAATASGAFSTAYREHFGEEGLEETLGGVLRQTPLLVPGFAALLTNQAPPEGALALTKDSLQTCFVQATRAISADRIAIVLIDDLHFAPDEGRALFASLAMAVPGHRILLVGTSRPPLDEKWASNIARIGHTTRMNVGRLGARDLVALLRDALKSSHLAEELAARIAEKTDGNPFFVFEVLRGLKDGQYLTQKADGTWATTRVIQEIRIPASIADMIQARVGDLTEEERSLLEIAACVGYEFDAGLVGDVAGLGRIPLLRAFGTIEKGHRLIRAVGRRYVFDHHQVQEHLYSGLSEFVREGYHAAIGEALERMSGAAEKDPETLGGALCADLADHLLRGALGDRALRYLGAAHRHLAARYLNDAAVRLAERALAVPGLVVGIERARMLLRLAAALDRLGRRVRQEEVAREADRVADGAGDPELRTEAKLRLGALFSITSRPEEAESWFRASLEVATAGGGRRVESAALTGLGLLLQYLGRFSEAMVPLDRALAISRELGDRALEANAMGNIGLVLEVQGQFAEAKACYERQCEMARGIGDRVIEASTTGNLGNVLSAEGRLSEARDHYERQIVIDREIGDRRGEAIALVNLGSLRLTLGDRAGTREALHASLALCRENGVSYPQGYGLLDLGRLAAEEGDTVGALRLMEESLELRRRIGHGDGVADSLSELAYVHLRSGDFDAARTAIGESLRLLHEQGRTASVAFPLAMAARLPGGDLGAALAAVAQDGCGHSATRTRWLLWEATGDVSHLAAARRLLDAQLALSPEECRSAMIENVRVNREIVAACREQGIS